MYIEELEEEEVVGARPEETACSGVADVFSERKGSLVPVDVKRVLVGAGARVLFYPTLLYNVVRSRMQPEFRWWDRVAEVQFCLFFNMLCYFICDRLIISISRLSTVSVVVSVIYVCVNDM